MDTKVAVQTKNICREFDGKAVLNCLEIKVAQGKRVEENIMIKLIRLELLRKKISTYLISSIIIAIVVLGFCFLFGYGPQIEASKGVLPSDTAFEIFMTWKGCILLIGTISLLSFAVMSAFILVGPFGNLFSLFSDSTFTVILIGMAILLVIELIILLELLSKVNKMEGL